MHYNSFRRKHYMVTNLFDSLLSLAFRQPQSLDLSLGFRQLPIFICTHQSQNDTHARKKTYVTKIKKKKKNFQRKLWIDQ